MTRRRISTLRLVVQLVAFGVLMYGGFAVRALQAPDEASYRAAESGPAGIQTVRKRSTVTDMPLPATACIYQREGLCRSCSLYYITDAITWLKPVEVFLPYLLVLVLFMLLAGRLWCGWVCPLGLLSDLLTRIRTSLGIAQVRLSKKMREGLVWAKYVLLVLSLGVATVAAFPALADQRLSLVDPFCQICPSRIFSAFFTFDDVCWTVTHDPITITFTVLGLIAFSMFFIGLTVRRFWCRLCPIGGMTALFNRAGLVMLAKDASRCTHCGSCARTCPLDVQRVYEGRTKDAVTSFECHLCLRCVEACPEEGCLQFKWIGKRVTGS